MTELKTFLASLYDTFSAAEMTALRHGHARLAELLERKAVPEDAALPVYHASEVDVTLDVGLVAEETEDGMELFVTRPEEGDGTELSVTVDLFEVIEREDLGKLDYEDLVGKNVATDERGRTTDDANAGRTAAPIDALDVIDAQYRSQLKSSGIERLSDLAERSPGEIAGLVAEADVTSERALEWIDEAHELASAIEERGTELPVELIDGIGSTFGRRLREADIESVEQLLDRSPEEVAEIVSTATTTVPPDRTAAWLDRAEATVAALEELREREELPDGKAENESAEPSDGEGSTPASDDSGSSEATKSERAEGEQ